MPAEKCLKFLRLRRGGGRGSRTSDGQEDVEEDLRLLRLGRGGRQDRHGLAQVRP